MNITTIIKDFGGEVVPFANATLFSNPNIGATSDINGVLFLPNVDPLDFISISYQGEEKIVIQANAIEPITTINVIESLDTVVIGPEDPKSEPVNKSSKLKIGLVLGVLGLLLLSNINQKEEPQKAIL